ncbi:hypothetical protein SD940_06465 [Lactobacillus gasseri]|jgi:hypothetical protein|uniref:Uncharacterized protein n=1 Tax=Lactobacillus gasseri TaxID=1596 RepID=A0ABY3BBE8_LACGS|nr:hypothetical protein [Lactobacillus gasseri]MCZ3948708.1 hypothetical protein [Lactobacillus gasseri]MDK7886729.1 hypothetical protein [Lactobacillus gasseri]MDX5108416.1 hypothetical protein [Lactobacillus gasseri]PKZ70210.1 hypothetical protein CYJ87_08680 [Lactobacillus gasseri]PKZ72261.1 hypothetical protein CYJ88_07240 [Lactobacillus gasseri]
MKKFDRFILGVMETLIIGLRLSVQTMILISRIGCTIFLMPPYNTKIYRWIILLIFTELVSNYINKSSRFELDRKLLKDEVFKYDKNGK